MGKRGIGEQARSVEYVELVYSVGQYLLFNACQIASGGNSLQLAALLIGYFSSFGLEFETDVGNRCAFYL